MNIIDIICAALIILLSFFGVIKGFFAVIINFAAYVISFISAKLLSAPLASFLYSRFIKDEAISKLRSLLPSGSVSGGIDELKQSLVSALPSNLVRIAEFFHLEKLFAAEGAAKEVLTVSQIEQNYVMPIVTKVLSILTFVLLFILLAIILRLISALINKALFKKKDSLLSTTNKIFGGIFGLIKGAVPAACICMILNLLAPLINAPKFTAVVEGSVLCGLVAKLLG